MLKLVVVLAIVACAHAAPSNNTLRKNPVRSIEDGKECYISQLDIVISVGGKVFTSEPCARLSCSENGLSGITCEHVIALPPCKMVINKNEYFPGCCPRWICP